MTRLYFTILWLAWFALLCFPARASTTTVTPALVATVQNAVRWRAPSWSPELASEVATALNQTHEPANLLAIAVIESQMRPRAHGWESRHVVNAGLLGIRCKLRHGRCTNWPVRGMTVAQLERPQVNIEAGAKVLAKKWAKCGRRALDCYRGDASGKLGRTGNVAALVAAFAGVEVRVKAGRVRELVRKIALAVRRESKS